MDIQNQQQTPPPSKTQKKKHKIPYNHPYVFSYADLIAAVFIALYVGTTVYALITRDDFMLQVMKELIAPVMLILGGYFGQQIASSYFMSKSPNQMQGYYGGYNAYGAYTGYPTYQHPDQTTTADDGQDMQVSNQIESPYSGQY